MSFITLRSFIKNYSNVVVFIILLGAVLLVYLPALSGTFLLDDYVWIEPLTIAQIKHLFVGSWEHGNTLRPIMRLEFFATRLLFGEWAFGWHLANIFFHTLISWSLYVIFYSITKRRKWALVAALIFAVFPTNHETVAWISGVTHPFGLLLSLAAGFLLLQACAKTMHWQWYGLGGYLFLLAALLTYEVSFVVPLILTGMLIMLGPRTRRGYGIIGGSWILLAVLVMYRLVVLGGSIGAVDEHQSNIFLAPFLNLGELKTIYLYATEIKIAVAALCALCGYHLFKKKPYFEVQNRVCLYSLVFFSSAVITYLPFAIVKGVAPRFLYSSLFFMILGFGTAFVYLESRMSKVCKGILASLVVFIFLCSSVRTWQVANRYKEVSDTYKLIFAQVKHDYLVWPDNKDMVFYGLPNTNKNVLAFLTYFNKALERNYVTQRGKVYRIQEMTAEELEEVLAKDPIKYEFIGFNKGVRKMLK
jgi:hypothetical protein